VLSENNPMAKVKSQLENLIRVQPDNEARMNCLRLDLNENIAGLPEQFVREVLAQVDAEFLATYPNYKGLIHKIAEENNLSVTNISLGNGSDGAIKNIFEVFISSGDKVLLTDPTFAMYNVYGRMFGAQEISVGYNQDFSFPEERFMEELKPGVKMAVIVNPNNPAGTALTPASIQKIARKAHENNILLLVDEAYFYFCPDTVIGLINECPNVLVLRTFSKLCALAATRIGFVAADENIIKHIEKVKPTYDINGFGVLFAACLLDRPQIITGLIADFKKAKNYFNSRLIGEGISFRESQANFTLIHIGKDVPYVMEKLKDEKILVGGGFRQGFLCEYIRVTIGNQDMMDRFLDAFLKIYTRLGHE